MSGFRGAGVCWGDGVLSCLKAIMFVLAVVAADRLSATGCAAIPSVEHPKLRQQTRAEARVIFNPGAERLSEFYALAA